MDIKPIETHYAGYKFRSRLEARWAVFFDAMGLEWEYEKEGYVLPGGVAYLPDFWLPAFQLFVEVKGCIPTKEEYWKAERIGHNVNACAVFHGTPGENYGVIYCIDVSDGSGGPSDHPCLWVKRNGDAMLWVKSDRDRGFWTPGWEPLPRVTMKGTHDQDSLRDPINAARSARFEHGESPGRRTVRARG